MAKIALISLYDNWALGVRTLSNAVFSKGHDVAVIHFKLPFQKRLEDFLKHPVGYENLQSRQSHSEVIVTGYNIDVNMWTPNECELLGDLLEDLRPDIIGLTTRTVYEQYIGCIVEQIKRVKSAIKLAGGFGSTMNPTKYLDDLDYACIGEGEQALVRIAECVDKGLREDIRHIPNLAYKLSGRVVFNNMEKPDDTEDHFYNARMEQIPHYVIENNVIGKTDVFMEYVRQLDPSYAYHAQTGLSHYYTMAGRGCMWNCSFCSAGKFYQLYSDNDVPVKRRRNRKIEKIVAELKLAKEHGFTRIYFMDSFLIGEESYLLEFFDLYKKEVNMPFFAQLFPDQVLKNPKILDKAVEAGMTSIVVGIQSGSERIRNKIFNRKETDETIVKFSNMICNYNNVLLDYHIITHNPFETIEDIKEAFDLIARLPKKNAQIVLLRLRPFPRSAIGNMIQEANLGNVNEEFHHKVFMLYLIRYHVSDDEFEKIFANLDKYSHIDLKNIYAEIRETHKNSADWTRIGWEHYHKARYNEAVEAFNSAIKMDLTNYRALNGRGWTHYQEKRYKEALLDFKNAIRYVTPTEREVLQEVLRGLAWVCYCKQDYDEAIKHFNEALEQTDSKATVILQDVFRGLGWSYYQKNDVKTSTEYFKKAIENIGSDNKEELQDALNGLSMAHKREGLFV